MNFCTRVQYICIELCIIEEKNNGVYKPDRTPCTESSVIEIARRGVKDANFFIISGLSLKKPAQKLCPNDRAETTKRARRTESFRVTAMALFARYIFTAPNSFDTLVLSQTYISFQIKFLKHNVN